MDVRSICNVRPYTLHPLHRVDVGIWCTSVATTARPVATTARLATTTASIVAVTVVALVARVTLGVAVCLLARRGGSGGHYHNAAHAKLYRAAHIERQEVLEAHEFVEQAAVGLRMAMVGAVEVRTECLVIS